MANASGKRAEDVAKNYLSRRGVTVVAQNVVYPFGEIDIVAEDKKYLVFIEVKYRHQLTYGYPLEAVNKNKQRKIIRAAHAYLQRYRGPLPYCRFDVLSMSGDLSDPVIEYVEDAFRVEDI